MDMSSAYFEKIISFILINLSFCNSPQLITPLFFKYEYFSKNKKFFDLVETRNGSA